MDAAVKVKYMGPAERTVMVGALWLHFQRLERGAEPGTPEMPPPRSPGASLPLAHGSASLCVAFAGWGWHRSCLGALIGCGILAIVNCPYPILHSN